MSISSMCFFFWIAIATAQQQQQQEYALKYSGVSLNFVAQTFTTQCTNMLREQMAMFSNRTGATITLDLYTSDVLPSIIQSDSLTGANVIDIFWGHNPNMAEYASLGVAMDLTDRIRRSAAQLEWNDITPRFRDYISSFNHRIYVLPVDGDHFLLYYRKDMLLQYGMLPPRTWDEVLSVAKVLNGTDMNGDGVPDYAMCYQSDPINANYQVESVAVQFLHTMQSQHTHLLFDMDVANVAPMTSLIQSAAWVEAFRITKQLYDLSHRQNLSIGENNALFTAGRCGMLLGFPSTGTGANTPGAYIRGRLGVSPIPGTKVTWRRSTNTLEPCDRTRCPQMTPDGINSVAFFAGGGVGMAINPRGAHIDAAFDFGVQMSRTLDVRAGSQPFNPFRYSQLSAEYFQQGGWEASDAQTYVAALKGSLESENFLIDIRTPLAPALHAAVKNAWISYLQDQTTVDKALAALNDNVFRIIRESKYTITEYEQVLRMSLGLPLLRTDEAASSPDVGLIVGLVIAAFAVLSVPILWHTTRTQRQLKALLKDDKVATELAEAVATMNFDDVQYLNDIRKPTRIQIAFIKIVDNLKLLRKYIPANVLVDDIFEESDIGVPPSANASMNAGSPLDIVASPITTDNSNNPKVNVSSRSSSGVSSNPAQHGKLRVQKPHNGFQQQRIAVIAVEFFPRCDAHVQCNSEKYLEAHSTMLAALLKIAHQHRGVPMHFFGNEVSLTYNAVAKCGARGYHALSTSKEFLEGVEVGTWGCVMGISTGYAWCGDVGPDNMMAYSIQGPAWEESHLLTKMYPPTASKQVGCYATGSIYPEGMADFSFMGLDVFYFTKSVDEHNQHGAVAVFAIALNPKGSAEKATTANTNNKSALDDVQACAQNVNHDNEWMYNLETEAARHEFNDAILGYTQNGSKELVEAFLAKHSESAMKAEMMMCETLRTIVSKSTVPERYFK